ncbi:MAG: TIGR03768 family metallophosphoesterase [Candidatus Micrarchaeia archaeon]|jgi:metallophosphoesterase (TIGR03768 family)
MTKKRDNQLVWVAIVVACIIFLCLVFLGNKTTGQQASYPIDSTVFTTLDRAIVPVPVPSASPKLAPNDISNFSKYGYGAWQFGNGQGYEKRLDLMPASYANASATTSANSANLLRFFAITDIHITDKESPAQAIFFGIKAGIISSYSPAMLYSTQTLDATVQTINALNRKKPFDFGISLGDATNSDQYNELRWYIDVLDGKTVNPDSGAKDDPVSGPLNDYQDEFKAAGLDKSINWYQTLGNHDHYWMGIQPQDDYIKAAMVGDKILNMGNAISDPIGVKSRGFYMGAVDGSTPYGNIIGAGLVKDFAQPPTIPAADPARRMSERQEWIGQFFNSSSSPTGHGFSQSNTETGFACYSFEPKSDIPIKVIVLDDTDSNDGPAANGYGRGMLDKQRYEWLVSELEKGQADGQLMIIAAHIPIGIEWGTGLLGSMASWSANAYVTEKELIAKLHTYPNLILWAAGHRHLNTVTALKSPDPSRPELGFWEVETSSLREFPRQFRTFDIVRNSDNTISIFATDVDSAVKEGSPADTARSYAIAAHEAFNLTMQNRSYNAELVKQLSPQMQDKIRNVGTQTEK